MASETYQEIREHAWSAATEVLARRGFAERGRGRWLNADLDWGHWRGPVWVHIPDGFPWQLPEVVVEDGAEYRPHVERSGKVCVAPATGLLLDFTRPGRIVEDVLEQAKQLLRPSTPKASALEIEREYQAYWTIDGGGKAFVSVRAGTADGSVKAEKLPGQGLVLLASSDTDDFGRWKAALGGRGSTTVACYFVRLSKPLPAPPRHRAWTLLQYLTEIERRCDEARFKTLLDWAQATLLPYAILVGMPSNDAHGSLCCAYVRFPASKTGEENKRNGFRKNKFPAAWAFKLALPERIDPLRTERIDHEFLVARTGGDSSLGSARACVFGMGSVGSFFTMALARAGVGNLRLIDPERITAANLHRHFLGASSIDQWKAEAMSRELSQKLPNVRVEHRPETADGVFAAKPGFVSECELVASATGEESIELAIAARVTNGQHRLHVWVEPLGLGGHVLALPRNAASGCLRCLFDHNDKGELTNLASLAEPGQEFQRTLGGCAGSFTPFGASDAEVIAATAASWGTRLLLGRVERPTLISWVNDRSRLVNAGFRLSRRGQTLEERRMHVHENFARPDCPRCGGA